jgi:hypothetical protein
MISKAARDFSIHALDKTEIVENYLRTLKNDSEIHEAPLFGYKKDYNNQE